MKTFKLHHKIIAIVLTLAFTFQSMSQINEHAYKTGVDSYHYFHTCFGGSFPSHLAAKCDSFQKVHFF